MGRKNKKRGINKTTLQSLITSILRQNPRKAFNYKQLSKQIGIGDDNTKHLIQIVLNEMEQQELVITCCNLLIHNGVKEGGIWFYTILYP